MPTAPTTSRRAAALPPDERRAAIVEATLPLLVEHGELVTTSQIAAAAGVAEGTIFRVFPDKEALLAATLEAAMDMAPLERALADVDPTASFDEQLTVATEIIQQRVVDLWQLISNLGPKLREQAARPMVDSAALVRILEHPDAELIVSPAAAARTLRAVALSMTHPMVAGDPLSAAEIVALFLHGVRGPR